MNLGERIYKYRTAKNMSQGDLAEALDVSRQSVSKWETGTAVPELDKLIRLAQLFEISLDELVGRTEQKTDSGAHSTIIIEPKIKMTLGICELIGIILIGVAVLVVGLALLIPNFNGEAGILLALILATAGVCCIWPLNHFSNIFTFVLDGIILLMCTASRQAAAVLGLPILTIFIIQCLRWIKTLPNDSQQEDNP